MREREGGGREGGRGERERMCERGRAKVPGRCMFERGTVVMRKTDQKRYVINTIPNSDQCKCKLGSYLLLFAIASPTQIPHQMNTLVCMQTLPLHRNTSISVPLNSDWLPAYTAN